MTQTPEYASTTTLRAIRKARPCEGGWEKLLSYLGKTSADDEPLNLLTVLDRNGFDYALWVLSYAMPDDRLARHFQARSAEHVLHIFEAECPEDMRVRDQIAMLLNDTATPDQRAAARSAARDAAWATTAGAATARDAAWAAGAATAWSAVRAAAWAEGASAWAASWAAQENHLRKMLAATS